MPNYNLVINSKFNPLSFSEMVQPYLMYKEEYEKQQDAISDLNEKASVWENLANKETDQRTYKQYKAYSDSLKAQANSMARWGLSPGTRSALVDLKSRYSSDIAPIQTAYDRRQKLAEEQRKGRAAGLIYDYDAATTSLDKFVFDNQKDYDSIDLYKTFDESAKTFGNFANELSNYGKGKAVDAYTNTLIQQHGITREQAAKFAEGVRNGTLDENDPVMKAMNETYNDLYGSTGVANWQDAEAQQKRVRDTILAGARFAIGQTNINTVDNYGAKAALNHSYQKELLQMKLKATKDKKDADQQKKDADQQKKGADQQKKDAAQDLKTNIAILNGLNSGKREEIRKSGYTPFKALVYTNTNGGGYFSYNEGDDLRGLGSWNRTSLSSTKKWWFDPGDVTFTGVHGYGKDNMHVVKDNESVPDGIVQYLQSLASDGINLNDIKLVAVPPKNGKPRGNGAANYDYIILQKN